MNGVSHKPWCHETIAGSVVGGINKVVGDLGPLKSLAKLADSSFKFLGALNVTLMAERGLDLIKGCQWIGPVSNCAAGVKTTTSFFDILGALKDATAVNADGQSIWKTGTGVQKVKICASLGAGAGEIGEILSNFKVFDLAPISAALGLNPLVFAKNTLAWAAAVIGMGQKVEKQIELEGKYTKQEMRIARLTGNQDELRAHYAEKCVGEKKKFFTDIQAKLQKNATKVASYVIKDEKTDTDTLQIDILLANAKDKLSKHQKELGTQKRWWSILYTTDVLRHEQVACDKWEEKQVMFKKLSMIPDEAVATNAEIDKLKSYYNDKIKVLDKKHKAIDEKFARWAALANPEIAPKKAEDFVVEKLVIAKSKKERKSQEIKKNVLGIIFEIAKIALLSTLIGLTIAGLVLGGPIGWALLIPALGLTVSAIGMTKSCVDSFWSDRAVLKRGSIPQYRFVQERQAMAPAA